MSNGSKPPISISDLYRKFVMYYSLSTQCKLQEQRHHATTTDDADNNNNSGDRDSDGADEDAEDAYCSLQDEAETDEQQGRSTSQLEQLSRRRVRRKGCRLGKLAAAGRPVELELDCLPSDVIIASRNVRNVDGGGDVGDDVISGPPRFRRRQLRVMTRQTVPETAESPDREILPVKYRYQPPRDHNGLRLPRCPVTSRQQLVTSSSVDGGVDGIVFNGGGLTSTSLDAAGGLRRAAKCRLQVDHESRSSQQPAPVYIYDVGEDSENRPLDDTETLITNTSPVATTSSGERVIATSSSFGTSTSSQLPDCGVVSSSFGASCRPAVLCTKKRVNRERASSLDSRLAQSTSQYGSLCVVANQKLSRSCSDEQQMKYNDPMVNSSPSFQQRIGEIILLEAQTIRWERIKKTKKLKQQHRESLRTSSVVD